jgi:hypothetical protein
MDLRIKLIIMTLRRMEMRMIKELKGKYLGPCLNLVIEMVETIGLSRNLLRIKNQMVLVVYYLDLEEECQAVVAGQVGVARMKTREL